MSCTSNTLTQLGSDTFVRANGALGSNWITPIELTQAVVIDTNTAYGGNNLGNNAEAQWNGSAIPSDQYAEVQWEYTGALSQHFDLTFRRDTTNNFAYWMVSFTHNSTSAFILDNNGVWESLFNLSSALATGDKVRVSLLGTQVCVFRDTGSGYALEHTDTLPSVLPTSTTVAGNPGFDLSALGRVSNFATGSVTVGGNTGQILISGSWQYPDGSPLANGILRLQLSQDGQVNGGNGQVSGGRIVAISLDANGNIPAGTYVYACDQMTPANLTYKVNVTAPGGALVWGMEQVAITGASYNFNTFSDPKTQLAGIS